MATKHPRVVWLDRGLVSRQVAGGKGASLSALASFGAPVPPAFAMTTNAYASFARVHNFPQRVSQVGSADLSELRSDICKAELPPQVDDALMSGWQEMARRTGGGSSLAVRSSATAEDSAAFSFAGLHDTIMDVLDPPALRNAVKSCWASLWSDRAVQYRRSAGESLDDASMGIVVQQMISSDVSFVVFTSDPVSFRDDHLVISATYGLGEAIVSGLVTPDQVVIDADGQVVEYLIGAKEVMVIPGSQPGQGVREVRVPRFLASQAVLTAEQACEIASLARRLADRAGYPADIEGGVVAGEVSLFQIRPITTLNGFSGRNGSAANGESISLTS